MLIKYEHDKKAIWSGSWQHMKVRNIEVFSHYERPPWLFSPLGSAALSNNMINCTWKLSSNLCLKLCHLCLVLPLFSGQKEFDCQLGCFYIQCYEKPASKQKINKRYSYHSPVTDISPRPKSASGSQKSALRLSISTLIYVFYLRIP